jgi:hypothetical protein
MTRASLDRATRTSDKASRAPERLILGDRPRDR